MRIRAGRESASSAQMGLTPGHTHCLGRSRPAQLRAGRESPKVNTAARVGRGAGTQLAYDPLLRISEGRHSGKHVFGHEWGHHPSCFYFDKDSGHGITTSSDLDYFPSSEPCFVSYFLWFYSFPECLDPQINICGYTPRT